MKLSTPIFFRNHQEIARNEMLLTSVHLNEFSCLIKQLMESKIMMGTSTRKRNQKARP